jgi:hypothetical protein
MGFFNRDDDNKDEQSLVENTQRLNVNEDGEQKEGWSTGSKVRNTTAKVADNRRSLPVSALLPSEPPPLAVVLTLTRSTTRTRRTTRVSRLSNGHGSPSVTVSLTH